jgi:hypothetical protein
MGDDEEVEADTIRDEMKSPGCFPIITSNVNTPKLYTSHFSSTFIVYANSAKAVGHAIFCQNNLLHLFCFQVIL